MASLFHLHLHLILFLLLDELNPRHCLRDWSIFFFFFFSARDFAARYKKKKKSQKLSLAGPLNKPILIGPNIELNHPYVVLTNQLTAYLAIKLPSPSCSFVTSLFPVPNEWQRQPSKVGNYGSFSSGGWRRRTCSELGECGAVLFGGNCSFNLHLLVTSSLWEVHVHSTDYTTTFPPKASSFRFPQGLLHIFSLLCFYTFVYIFACVQFLT